MAITNNLKELIRGFFTEVSSGVVGGRVQEQNLIGGESADGLTVLPNGLLHYVATAATNEVVADAPARLHRIIVGEDVASSTIEVSDHASDGDGNVKIFLDGDALAGVYEVGAVFSQGITADIVNQTKVTFVYSLIS